MMLLHQLPRELLTIVLITSSSWLPHQVAASPAVNVALQASFNSPPYLLELLYVTSELASDESHTDYLQRDCSRGELDSLLSTS